MPEHKIPLNPLSQAQIAWDSLEIIGEMVWMSFSAQNKAEFYVLYSKSTSLFSDPAEGFSESRRTFTISFLQVFLLIFKDLQYVKAYGLWSTDFKSKTKAWSQSMCPLILITASVSAQRAIRLSSTLCPRSGAPRKYWHHVCHLSISAQAQRLLKAGGDTLQLAI